MKMKFIATATLATLFAFPMVSHAYQACQCVEYIKNRVGDQRPAGNAHEMDGYLQRNGYRLVNLNHDAPRNKDIVIIRRGFGGIYNTTYGHVGIVSSATGSAGSTFQIQMVSSNMNNTAWTGQRKSNPNYPERSEYGCDNVSGNVLTVSPSKYSQVAVYRR